MNPNKFARYVLGVLGTCGIFLMLQMCVTQKACFERWGKETVTVRDTIISIPPTETDTFLVWRRDTLSILRSDTVIATKDRVRIQIVRRNDTVFVKGECLPDTIRVPIEVTKVVIDKPPDTWFDRNKRELIGLGTIFLAAVLLIWFIAKR